MVALRNLSRGMIVLNLPSAVVPECAKRGVLGTLRHDPRSGERTLQAKKRWVSGSVTIPAGETSDLLPESALRAPDVQAAIRQRVVVVVDKTPEAEPAPGAQPETSSPPKMRRARVTEE